MDDNNFIWSPTLAKRFFQLRFDHEWLFKKKKQPWSEFHKILMENGFPTEMTINHIRKKWSYTMDSYRIAKRTRNKNWRYYRMFEKHFGKTKVLDKYESWTDEWRLKLVMCISETQDLKLNFQHFWRTVENGMRCLGLPPDCCVYDMKRLWQHIKMTFNRKHRLKIRKGAKISDWPLYDVMLNYFQRHEPTYVSKLESESTIDFVKGQKVLRRYKPKSNSDSNECIVEEFHWTRDITESFIQIRLQNDWLFKENKTAWNRFLNIMIHEHGFPKTLSRREIAKKWTSIYAEYQKAKAKDNKSWVYYNLFEAYLGEGNFSLNPLVGWQEEWILKLIEARSNFEYCFTLSDRDEFAGWREVEKRLRSMGLPLDHSLLDLPEMWQHLLRTFRWKKKFASRGMLNAPWPYYDAMLQYTAHKEAGLKVEAEYDNDNGDDNDYEDDIKLFDLKQRMVGGRQPQPSDSDAVPCRACFEEAGAVTLHDQVDREGLDLAFKLKAVCGVEVLQTDKVSVSICLKCKQELENAFKFRRKCQVSEARIRQLHADETKSIKTELQTDDAIHAEAVNDNSNAIMMQYEDYIEDACDIELEDQTKVERRIPRNVHKKRKAKSEYKYWKICEICGKNTQNLNSHLDMHKKGKEYSCEVCDKKFKFKSGLIIHRAIHNPTPKKTCEICGKTFHILAQYRRHFVYHANERRYECDTCGKRFNTPDILKVHKRMHTDERPFSCQDCGKTFRTAGCVSRHKRIVHKKKEAKVVEIKIQRVA